MILSAKIQNIPDSPNVFAQNVPDSPNVFYPKYSRFPKCLVKTEEKYTDEPNTSRPSLGSQIKDFGTKTQGIEYWWRG